MARLGTPSDDPIRVLYVNSDPDFTELVRTKLHRTGFEIDYLSASSIAAALTKLSAERIDCVVTAYSLAEANGIDLTRAIRQRDTDIPIILFTGQGTETIASDSTRAGVTDYIPIRADRNDFEVLAGRIKTLAEAARERHAAERATEQLQRTLERTTDAVYAVDDEWRIEYMNDTMADRIDRDPDDVVGGVLWDEFPSITGTDLEEAYRTAMETGRTRSFEHHVGEPFDYWVEIRAFPDEDGLTVFSREITDEHERRLALERYETIVEHSHDAVFVVNEDGAVRYANSAAARVVGESRPTRLEGAQLESLFGARLSEADAERLSNAVERTIRDVSDDSDGTALSNTQRQIDIRTTTGTRTLDVRVTPVRNSGSREVAIVTWECTDQSEVHRQLQRERDALRELRTVVEADTASVDERLQALVEVGCRVLGLEIGIVSRIEGSDYRVRAVHAPDTAIDVGDTYDLESTYCAAVVDRNGMQSFADASAAGNDTHPASRECGLESYIGVPLVVDGDRYGTLNFSSPTARVAPFGTTERTVVELIAGLVSTALTRSRERADLERQQLLFDELQDTAEIGIWEYAPATGEIRWSDGARRLHGSNEDGESALSEMIECYHPDDRDAIRTVIDRAIEDGESYDLDLRLVRSDGDARDVRVWVNSADSTQHDGPIVRGVIQDVTERMGHEYQALAEEYNALLNTSGDAIFLLDVDATGDEPAFRFTQLSQGYETQTGLTTEEVYGKTPREVFGDERGATLTANYRRCVEQRGPISYREELPIAEDARVWETSLAPVTVNGDIVRLVGIARNVTDQVDRERELEETNQRLESLIEAAPLTIMEIDPDGHVVLWNNGAEEMFGWTRDEVIGEFNPVVPDDRQAEFATHRERALNGDRIRGKEVQRETKDGERLDLLLSVVPLTDQNGEVTSVLAVLEDITAQKQLETHLRSLQETAQQLSRADSIEEIGSIAVDAAAEILGLEITGIWKYDERGDALVPVTETAVATALFGESPRFTAGDSLAWNVFESGELQVYDDVQTRNDLHNPETEIRSEILIPLGNYGLMSTGSRSTRAFSDTDVDLFRILGATVEAALSRANREAMLHRQNERLDQFASVVAHDLRNPLTVAMGFLEIAEETGDPDHFEQVESAHERMKGLIADLLTLAQGETTVEETTQVALERVAREAWGYVDTDEATLTIGDEVPTVAGDEGRLIQLFENLFRNAVEHGGTDVTVTVGRLAERDGFYVADDGQGIPPAMRDDVFEHGVTSQENGTGLGLSIVADIAKAHGWTGSVTGGTEGGARFEFETRD
ncbi:PAS domain S-box protein [Natrinema altunense]|uniref:histidine kinase n=1 Tax=Natrinema altunense (strain JCM 12890 / CGMCC 1.3731 / AJ2) TaxID=1227494 RepID=L9ZLB4_NATA2|nr:11-domain light and oxygen sensing his kinase [Natrinema altunense JCM 12890]